MKGNVNFTNEIIDACDPREDVTANDILTELITTLKGMEDKMITMISSIESEDVMNLALLINDDLHKTFKRYEKL